MGFFPLLLSFKLSVLGQSLSDFLRKCFLAVCSLSYSLDTVFHRPEILIFSKSGLSALSFMDHAFGISFERSLPFPRSPKFSPVI